MKKAVIITLVFAVVVVSLGWWKFHHAKNPRHANVSEYESDMTAGLLHIIFQELDSRHPPVYFIAFGEARTEPSYSFITQFAGHHPPVRSFTAAVSTPNGLVLETATGRAGVIIQIISFKEFVTGTFDILVALSNQPPGHDRFTYRIFNNGGDWILRSRKPA